MMICMRKKNALLASRQHAKRGFTLTEIAIVLGIVGLILGAIWVAASAVYNNLRVSRATTELLDIAQNVRAMYATSSTVDSGSNMTVSGAQSAGGLTYVQAGTFPSDMISSGTTIQNPWGGGVAIEAETANVANDAFAVEFDKVPQNACIALVTSNTGGGRDTGLFFVGAGSAGSLSLAAGSTPTASTFPMAASYASGTLCTAASNNVAFMFKLRG